MSRGWSAPPTGNHPPTPCTDGEIFYSLAEAKVLIENWRRPFNTGRLHRFTDAGPL